jgi:hypothetical protein
VHVMIDNLAGTFVSPFLGYIWVQLTPELIPKLDQTKGLAPTLQFVGFSANPTWYIYIPVPILTKNVQSHDILYKVSPDILYTPGARSAPG